MGQQQLILLLVVVVVASLGTVAAMDSYQENRADSQADALTHQGIGLAGDVIAWYLKPTAQNGGGQQAASLANLTLDQLGYEVTESTTWHGYTLTGGENNGVMRFLGASTTHPFVHLYHPPTANGMVRVEVHAFGPFQECIVMRHDRYDTAGSNQWSDGRSEGEAPDNPNPARCSW